jgi:hypothetical protein
MLDVYMYPIPRPPGSLDLSQTPLDSLADAVVDICDHQRDVVLWFGYLDGWMLNPREEALIRKALRKFTCILVSCVPLALSVAWQNELRTIYTAKPYGATHIDDNGSAVHDGSKTGYGDSGEHTTAGQFNH